MEFTEQQVRELLITDVHFPPNYPDLGSIDLTTVCIETKTDCRQNPEQQSEPHGSLEVVKLTEPDGLKVRFIPLAAVQAIFFPCTTKRTEVDLDRGVWVFEPQLASEAASTIGNAKSRVGQESGGDNSKGLGIVFVKKDARILNVFSVAASAEESLYLSLERGPRNDICGPHC